MQTALFQILVMLGQGPAEATVIRERLRLRGDHLDIPSIPAFYRHLKSGIDEGWIEVRGQAPGERARGRPSQLYALSKAGRRALRQRATWLQKLSRLALESSGR